MNWIEGGVTAPKGFKAAGVVCGIKKSGKDLALIYSETAGLITGAFTANSVKAAPVEICLKQLIKTKKKVGIGQAIVINSGNANACTGKQGLRDAYQMKEITAKLLKIKQEHVFVASTGIIGHPLPMRKIKNGIRKAVENLSEHGSRNAAEAIMTTDTFPKEVAIEFYTAEKQTSPVRIGGIAKGAGMISPHLKCATMLCFLTTDAVIEEKFLYKSFKNAIENSFNRITVDGEMSTNDTVLILANGRANNKKITQNSLSGKKFYEALNLVCEKLAKLIVKDGEGATKFIEVKVTGAPSSKLAERFARQIANSLLVKTAIYGSDLNWGRIIAALGATGLKVNLELIDLYIGKLAVLKKGNPMRYNSKIARKILSAPDIQIYLNLHSGNKEATIWTCDLTENYIKINSHYST